MRFILTVSLLLSLTLSLKANQAESSFLKTCKKNSSYNTNICECSYKLFTRRYKKEFINTPEKIKQLNKYLGACQNIDEKLQVYTFDRLEKIIKSARDVGWAKLQQSQREKMIHIINESRRLYFKSCQVGFEHGCYNVARIYTKGLSKNINLKKANEYLKKACINGLEAVCTQ